jgi:hypothetical protein
MTKYKD